MTREQRESELRELLTTQRGKEEVLSILKKHAGIGGQANLPPFGTLLVDTILNYEYQPENDSGRAEPVLQKQAEGDIKFDEPPGRESPGG